MTIKSKQARLRAPVWALIKNGEIYESPFPQIFKSRREAREQCRDLKEVLNIKTSVVRLSAE